MENKILFALNQSKYALSKLDLEEILQESIDDEVIETLKNNYSIVETITHKLMPFNRGVLRKGIIRINKNGSGVFESANEKFIIDKDNTMFAIDYDEVLVKPIYSKKASDKHKAIVFEVIKRDNIEIIGEVYSYNGIKYVKPQDNSLRKLIIKLDDENVMEGHKVKVKLNPNELSEKIDCKLIKDLGHKDDPDMDIRLILEEYNVEVDFPDEVMEEVRKFPKEVLSEEKNGIMDLTSKDLVTIDGNNTKDIDDAVYVRKLDNGHYEVIISIANDQHYVKLGGEIFKEALKRGTSIYFLNSSIPMLPRELSNGICSLNPEVERLALSTIMEFDSNLQLINYKKVESVIKSKKQMTYEKVNKILNGEEVEGYQEFKDMILVMKEFSDIVGKNRLDRGCLNFDRDEIEVIVDEFNNPIGLSKKEKGEAQKIVENLMVLSGEQYSAHMSMMNIPFHFRIHAKPKPEVIKNFIELLKSMGYEYPNKTLYDDKYYLQDILKYIEDLPEKEVLKMQFLRCLPRAIYDINNIGHAGLASEKYTQETAPIRRILDLISQYLAIDFMIKKDDRQSTKDKWKDLEAMTKQATIMEQKAEKVSRRITEMKALEYMGYHLNEQFEGTINSIDEKHIYVTLDNLIEGSINFSDLNDFYVFDSKSHSLTGKNTGDILMMGDRLLLAITRIDKKNGIVNFRIESKLKSVKMNPGIVKPFQKVKKRKNSDYQK